ncbi:MAG: DEAD/DEAH box helicase, partial [Gemmatimonadota bacterium]|nr:DEAD/DEAH box helicase [Gemmatimonadota bacterium]
MCAAEKKVRYAPDPQMSVQYLPGVGPRRAGMLSRLGVERVIDLLYFLPKRYLDATSITPVSAFHQAPGEVTVAGTVVSARTMFGRHRRKLGFEAVLDDGTGRVSCRFFGRAFLKDVIARGQSWIVFGRPKSYRDKIYLDPLEYELIADQAGHRSARESIMADGGGVLPIYPLTEGLTQGVMRRITTEALPAASRLEDRLPEALRSSRGLMTRAGAIKGAHRPAGTVEALRARENLVFEELFFLELMLLGRKFHLGTEKRTRAYRKHNNLVSAMGRSLPFTLTEAQKSVLRTIDNDLTGPHPMNRLVQGDVGSGKTVVAVFAALRAVENGYQAALMAPTEVLAEQHNRTLRKLLEPLGIEPVCLLGKLGAKARRSARELITSGKAPIAVGTHALIQEGVEFADLGLVIIDEQHRFGVNQRLALKRKGRHTDCLVMTATP